MALTFGDFLAIFTTNDGSGGRAIKATFDTGIDDAANYLTKNDPAGGRAIKVVNVGAPLGPQFWTEAYTATTQATSSWTPVGAATDINAAIRPKGTGAITAAIPDGTVTGGNARGQYAVDLQMVRNNANQVAATSFGIILGGERNSISALSYTHNTIVGGQSNTIGQYAPFSSIVGGQNNTIQDCETGAFIGGGNSNRIDTRGNEGGIVAGSNNRIAWTGCFIGGGGSNYAGRIACAIVGGSSNTNNRDYSFIGGGSGNTINGNSYATITGGASNTASGQYSFVGGGQTNTASGSHSSVIGGQSNTASGYGAIAGGSSCTSSGGSSVVLGGGSQSNADCGIAIGRFCTANGPGQRGIVAMGNYSSAGTDGGVAIGMYCSSTNFYAVALGNSSASGQASFAAGSSTASGDYSAAVGSNTLSNLYGQTAHASGQFSAGGDAQAHELVWRRAITGTATTELFLDGAGVAAILPSTNAIWHGVIDIAAVCTVAGDGTTVVGAVEASSFKVTIKRIGTTTSLVGTVQEIGTVNADVSMATSVVTIDNNDTNESLRIQFTPPGTAGSTTVIRVVATFRGLQIKY